MHTKKKYIYIYIYIYMYINIINELIVSKSILYICVLPEPTRILRLPEYKVVQRNMDAVFECKVKHDPSLVPTMTWLKDHAALPKGNDR